MRSATGFRHPGHPTSMRRGEMRRGRNAESTSIARAICSIWGYILSELKPWATAARWKAHMSGLSVEVSSVGSECVIGVSGEVDIDNADDLASVGVLTATSATTQDLCLVLDLSQVTFMDSTGLGALVRIRNAAARTHREVTLRGLHPNVDKILTITDLKSVFTIEATADDPAREDLIAG